MKISKLSPSSIFASKAKDEKITLFFNKATGTVCYKNENNEVIEVGNGVSDIEILQAESWLYTEVPISSPEILTLGSVGKTLLAAPGEDKYYEVSKIMLEFTYSTSQYILADYIVVGAYPISANFITGNQFVPKKVATVNNPISAPTWDNVESTMVEFAYLANTFVNQPVNVYTWLGTDPTNGEGTILAKVWYKVRTFGSEL